MCPAHRVARTQVCKPQVSLERHTSGGERVPDIAVQGQPDCYSVFDSSKNYSDMTQNCKAATAEYVTWMNVLILYTITNKLYLNDL
jgi:hypothetical protein